jgi:hypothetical protein
MVLFIYTHIWHYCYSYNFNGWEHEAKLKYMFLLCATDDRRKAMTYTIPSNAVLFLNLIIIFHFDGSRVKRLPLLYECNSQMKWMFWVLIL